MTGVNKLWALQNKKNLVCVFSTMNILCQIVHGTKEIPDLGEVTKEVPTPSMSKLSRATFGLGWFWDVESQFGCQPGVVITRVGYAGGDTQSPTYYKLGDHTEVVDVFFDPDITSYEALLSYYFSHLGQKTATSRQYRSVIMCHNSDQLGSVKLIRSIVLPILFEYVNLDDLQGVPKNIVSSLLLQ